MPLPQIPVTAIDARSIRTSAARCIGALGVGALGVGALGLGLTACGTPDEHPPMTSGPDVVVTTPILGSVAAAIIGCAGAGDLEVLMPNGTDPHDFTPSSAQIAAMVKADLVIANGLGLESGMAAAFTSAGVDGGRIWQVGPNIDPIPFASPGPDDAHQGEDAHESEHEHEALDPHLWFDMQRMALAARLMGSELQQVAGDTGPFEDCGEQVAADIEQAQGEVQATLATVPTQRRVLVTDHEALGYLADAYGFQIAGAVIPSMSTMAEPSSADLARLAEVIRAKGVPAIFANVSQPAQLAEAVAAESGTEVVVVPLYVESLGEPGSPAADYIGMMKENARLIAAALAP